jgi:hypothetical protein
MEKTPPLFGDRRAALPPPWIHSASVYSIPLKNRTVRCQTHQRIGRRAIFNRHDARGCSPGPRLAGPHRSGTGKIDDFPLKYCILKGETKNNSSGSTLRPGAYCDAFRPLIPIHFSLPFWRIPTAPSERSGDRAIFSHMISAHRFRRTRQSRLRLTEPTRPQHHRLGGGALWAGLHKRTKNFSFFRRLISPPWDCGSGSLNCETFLQGVAKL